MKKQLSLLALYWLRFWAKRKLSQINPITIGVTGSAGKSTTVAAIEAILKAKYKVKATEGGNSESGLPLSILGLKMTDYSILDWLKVLLLAPSSLVTSHSYDVLVCEMGIDELAWPKNMAYLLTIVQPKIGVFLNVLPVHTEQMKSLANIAAEKGKLIARLPPDGTAIVNKDDQLTHVETAAKTVFFSGDSLAAAKAVGKIFGLSHLPSFSLPPGRWTVFKGINGSTLIDSSYNASPAPMVQALENLKKFQISNFKFQINRHIAVLGDMRELGRPAPAEHKKIAKLAFQLAGKVITVGSLTKKYYPKNPKLLAQFSTSWEAGKFLQDYLKPGDVVLFKGSQNTIFLETAVEMCLANKSDAARLCRRGQYWDKQREKFSH